jgi:hypothetical protein
MNRIENCDGLTYEEWLAKAEQEPSSDMLKEWLIGEAPTWWTPENQERRAEEAAAERAQEAYWAHVDHLVDCARDGWEG